MAIICIVFTIEGTLFLTYASWYKGEEAISASMNMGEWLVCDDNHSVVGGRCNGERGATSGNESSTRELIAFRQAGCLWWYYIIPRC